MNSSAKNNGTTPAHDAIPPVNDWNPNPGNGEFTTMNDLMIKMYLTLKSLMAREEGQDLVEYALVVALIAFGAITSMKFLSSGINTAFSDIGATLTSNIS
jgi:pilus assembly protein Flp/PilA